MIMISSSFTFNFTSFRVIVSFFIKLLISGILFSIAVKAVVVVVVVQLVILGISPSSSIILA